MLRVNRRIITKPFLALDVIHRGVILMAPFFARRRTYATLPAVLMWPGLHRSSGLQKTQAIRMTKRNGTQAIPKLIWDAPPFAPFEPRVIELQRPSIRGNP